MLEAEVGLIGDGAGGNQSRRCLQLVSHWDAHREAATSQTNVLEGAQTEALWSWNASLERWRLMVAA